MRLLLLLLLGAASFQANDWTEPFSPHRVIGPVYYVGTRDLACFLITSPQGHIVINTGLEDSGPMIGKNIEKLGFKATDVRILLTNQAHYDHVAAMSWMKKATGARFLATEADKPVLEDGGRSDFFLGRKSWFPPVKVDGVLQDGEVIKLGDVQLRTHITPGHTKGSVTYSMQVKEDGRDYNVVFANMPTLIGAPLAGNKKYPSIAADYEKSHRVLKALACDVFLAAHGSQYRMLEKYKPAYNPGNFVDPEGFRRAVAEYERQYRDKL